MREHILIEWNLTRTHPSQPQSRREDFNMCFCFRLNSHLRMQVFRMCFDITRHAVS
jgi:hypothetical protein